MLKDALHQLQQLKSSSATSAFALADIAASSLDGHQQVTDSWIEAVSDIKKCMSVKRENANIVTSLSPVKVYDNHPKQNRQLSTDQSEHTLSPLKKKSMLSFSSSQSTLMKRKDIYANHDQSRASIEQPNSSCYLSNRVLESNCSQTQGNAINL